MKVVSLFLLFVCFLDMLTGYTTIATGPAAHKTDTEDAEDLTTFSGHESTDGEDEPGQNPQARDTVMTSSRATPGKKRIPSTYDTPKPAENDFDFDLTSDKDNIQGQRPTNETPSIAMMISSETTSSINLISSTRGGLNSTEHQGTAMTKGSNKAGAERSYDPNGQEPNGREDQTQPTAMKTSTTPRVTQRSSTPSELTSNTMKTSSVTTPVVTQPSSTPSELTSTEHQTTTITNGPETNITTTGKDTNAAGSSFTSFMWVLSLSVGFLLILL